jgi:hypothetical protein
MGLGEGAVGRGTAVGVAEGTSWGSLDHGEMDKARWTSRHGHRPDCYHLPEARNKGNTSNKEKTCGREKVSEGEYTVRNEQAEPKLHQSRYGSHPRDLEPIKNVTKRGRSGRGTAEGVAEGVPLVDATANGCASSTHSRCKSATGDTSEWDWGRAQWEEASRLGWPRV